MESSHSLKFIEGSGELVSVPGPGPEPGLEAKKIEELMKEEPDWGVCRVCLAGGSGGRRLEGRRARLMSLCTGLPLARPGDGLPQGLCARCTRRLQVAATFRRIARRTNALLRHNHTQLDYSNPHTRLSTDTDADSRINLVQYELPAQIPDNPLPLKRESEIFLQEAHLPAVKDEPDSSERSDNDVFLKEDESDDDMPLRSIKKRKEKKFKCKICSKPLSTKYSLKHHTVNMHGENKKRFGNATGWGADKRFHCSECQYSTPHSQSLVYHTRIHTGEKPYKCDKCEKCFSQPGSLNAHKKTHSDKTYYTCKLCSKEFKYRETYESHKNVHLDVKTFVCNICNKGLKSKKTLEGHMNRHYNIRNYSCETCGATFVTHVELLNHSKKHAQEKKFACNLCNFKTYVKKGLENHLRRHMGDRPYECDLCDLSCYTKGELKCHRRKHTKEKIYSCPVCEIKFIHSSSVNKHMLRLHGIKYTRENLVDRRIVK